MRFLRPDTQRILGPEGEARSPVAFFVFAAAATACGFRFIAFSPFYFAVDAARRCASAFHG